MAHGMCTHESINFNSNALPYVMCRVRDEQRIQFEQTWILTLLFLLFICSSPWYVGGGGDICMGKALWAWKKW